MDLAESPNILYHYCSAASFHSILSTRSIWLSSLSLANDTMEGRLLSKLIMQHAQDEKISVEGVSKLGDHLEFLETGVEGLAFCVSAEGDLLSQWRGYADDARGFAIGFDGAYLVQWAYEQRASMSLERVTYDLEDQRTLTALLYRELSTRMMAAIASRPPWYSDTLDPTVEDLEFNRRVTDLTTHLYTMKGRAFREEKEWRLLSVNWPMLADFFGDPPTQFRCADGRIVPYVQRAFPDLDRHPIAEVILGPKNITPLGIVQRLLMTTGFSGVTVRHSEATYR